MNKYYGQYGQDSIIAQFFESKGIKNGTYVDIGASEGIRFSNTWLLEQLGWRGICVEAHPDYAQLLTENRPNSVCYSAAAGDRDKVKVPISLNYRASLTTLDTSLESNFSNEYRGYYGDRNAKKIKGFLNGMHEVEMRTIDSLIEENKSIFPKIDLLCIDIDGSEKYAFQALTLSLWNPELLVLEHSTVGEAYVDNFAQDSGYLVGKRIGSDTFYVKNVNDSNLLSKIHVVGSLDQKSTIHLTEK